MSGTHKDGDVKTCVTKGRNLYRKGRKQKVCRMRIKFRVDRIRTLTITSGVLGLQRRGYLWTTGMTEKKDKIVSSP